MASEDFSPTLKILVTGFGQYRQFTTNPSWQIALRLPETISHRGVTIQILKPTSYIKGEYRYIIDTLPQLIDNLKPDAIISIGQDELAKDFKIERGSSRDIYFECPDRANKTLTRKETKALWSECPERLENEGVERILKRWKSNYSNGKGAAVPGMEISNDAGNFVCGLLYYTVLAHLRRKEESLEKAVFLHVPPLKTDAELDTGKKIVEALIKAMAENCDVFWWLQAGCRGSYSRIAEGTVYAPFQGCRPGS